ncbi:MAG: hypothetical protein MI739_04530, partial [Bacteroidales bacterium]|nr:hypothetical protein [Bacteroidales bacterium]
LEGAVKLLEGIAETPEGTDEQLVATYNQLVAMGVLITLCHIIFFRSTCFIKCFKYIILKFLTQNYERSRKDILKFSICTKNKSYMMNLKKNIIALDLQYQNYIMML